MRRLFWVGVGAVASVVAVERIRRAARHYTPAAVSQQLTSVGERATSALHEALVRFDTARAAREQELVAALLVTPTGGDADAVFGRKRSGALPPGSEAGRMPRAVAASPPGTGPDVPPGGGASPSSRAPTGRVDAGEPLYDF